MSLQIRFLLSSGWLPSEASLRRSLYPYNQKCFHHFLRVIRLLSWNRSGFLRQELRENHILLFYTAPDLFQSLHLLVRLRCQSRWYILHPDFSVRFLLLHSFRDRSSLYLLRSLLSFQVFQVYPVPYQVLLILKSSVQVR